MNILLDECIDRRLSRDLVGHAVTTVPRRGWAGINNGDLLTLAEKEFDAFITVDRKLRAAGPNQILDRGPIASRALESVRGHTPSRSGHLQKLPQATAG